MKGVGFRSSPFNFAEPVIFQSIEAKTKADEQKMTDAMVKLSGEDPTFRVRNDAETGQTIIGGMGELHLEIMVDRMKREYNVEANISTFSTAFGVSLGLVKLLDKIGFQ